MGIEQELQKNFEQSRLGKESPVKKTEQKIAEQEQEKGEIFSRDEMREINSIPELENRAIDIEERLPFLSGKKRKDAEKDLVWCKGEHKRLLDFVIEGIKKTLGGNEVLNGITPDDFEIVIEKGEQYQLGNYEKQEKYYNASMRQNNFETFLWKQYNFKRDLADSIFCEAALRASGREAEIEESFGFKKEPEKLSYEYFDPAEELEKIGKFSEEELKLSPKEKTRIKKERMAVLKEKMAEQMIGFAKINSQLEEIILEKGITDKNKMESFLMNNAPGYKLSPVQLEKYRHVFVAIEEQARRVDKFAEDCRGASLQKIFNDIFHFWPKGEVKITKGPLSFCVACDYIDDFSRLYSGFDDDQHIKKARKVQGVALSGHVWHPKLYNAVIGINNSVIREYMGGDRNNNFYLSIFNNTKTHEEKHVLYGLTKDVDVWGDYKKLPREVKKEVGQKVLNELMKATRLKIEKWAKNEIFAYLKDGHGIRDIGQNLFQKQVDGGLYDYFEMEKADYSSSRRFPSYSHFERDLMDEEHEKERKKYEQDVSEALKIADILLRIGYSRPEIVGLFEAEPLIGWPKVFDRMRASKDFQDRKKIALKTTTQFIEIRKRDMEEYQKDLEKECKRKLEDQHPAFQRNMQKILKSSQEDYQEYNFWKEKLEKM